MFQFWRENSCHFQIKMRFNSIVFWSIWLWLHFYAVNPQQYFDIPSSPCPQLFQYKFDGNNWIGELELPSPPIQHREVILNLVLSLRAATTVRNVWKLWKNHWIGIPNLCRQFYGIFGQFWWKKSFLIKKKTKQRMPKQRNR